MSRFLLFPTFAHVSSYVLRVFIQNQCQLFAGNRIIRAETVIAVAADEVFAVRLSI